MQPDLLPSDEKHPDYRAFEGFTFKGVTWARNQRGAFGVPGKALKRYLGSGARRELYSDYLSAMDIKLVRYRKHPVYGDNYLLEADLNNIFLTRFVFKSNA
jgi:hypothetical protein